MKAYFDESGNTGSNWLDVQQPYFVYGGWVMSDDRCTLAEQVLRECFSKSKATELKSKYIWQKRRSDLITFINRMIDEAEAIPCFGVADKRYMIAAKMCETFFDPEYNPYVNGVLTVKSELKKALADSLSENNSLICDFAELIKQGTIDLPKMRLIRDAISDHFAAKCNIVVSTIESLSDNNLISMIAEFECITKNGAEKRWMSFVEPILFERLVSIDRLCDYINERGTIYVDELSKYEDVFARLNDIIQTGHIYKFVSSVEMRNSKTELLIQSADLLSGFVARSFGEINNVSSDVAINQMWCTLIGIRDFFSEKGVIAWEYYAKDDFVDAIARLAGCKAHKKCPPEEIIMMQFPMAIK